MYYNTNHASLGSYVHGKEITPLDYNIGMVRIVKDRNDRIISPLGRALDLGSFFASLLYKLNTKTHKFMPN
jgi:hypothetical protein